MSSVVLDASALLAFVRSESGADVVAKHLNNALLSAVNYSEVLKKNDRARRGHQTYRGSGADSLDCDRSVRHRSSRHKRRVVSTR